MRMSARAKEKFTLSPLVDEFVPRCFLAKFENETGNSNSSSLKQSETVHLQDLHNRKLNEGKTVIEGCNVGRSLKSTKLMRDNSYNNRLPQENLHEEYYAHNNRNERRPWTNQRRKVNSSGVQNYSQSQRTLSDEFQCVNMLYQLENKTFKPSTSKQMYREAEMQKGTILKPNSDEPEEEQEEDKWVHVRSKSRKDPKRTLTRENRSLESFDHNVMKVSQQLADIKIEQEEIELEKSFSNRKNMYKTLDTDNALKIQKTDLVNEKTCKNSNIPESVPMTLSNLSQTEAKPETKKKKTNAQFRQEFQTKLKRLPTTRGKVLTVSSDMFQFMNQGEQTPQILSRKDIVEEISFGKGDFPELGEEKASHNNEYDSGWSDVEFNENLKVLEVEDYPKLEDASVVKFKKSKRPKYSELFKKVNMKNCLAVDNYSCNAPTSAAQISSRYFKNDKHPQASEKGKASKKPKSNSLIKYDLANILVKQQEIRKVDYAPKFKEKRMTKVKPFVANILDSSAPSRRRGKEREIPRKKTPTTMKKIILKERIERKEAKATSLVPPAIDNIDVVSETNEFTPENEEIKIECQNLAANLTRMHSKNFREYCHQTLSPEIDEVATKLIQDLIRFHDRIYQKDPIKAKMRRRMVTGLREITKHLKSRRIKCLILAPNVEKISNQGGLDDALNIILSLASEQNVPVVFALGRRKLGRVCLKKVPVSGIGIFNYDGSESNFKKLMELTLRERENYFCRRGEIDTVS